MKVRRRGGGGGGGGGGVLWLCSYVSIIHSGLGGSGGISVVMPPKPIASEAFSYSFVVLVVNYLASVYYTSIPCGIVHYTIHALINIVQYYSWLPELVKTSGHNEIARIVAKPLLLSRLWY